jgi:uncharacterized integral membrane protein (TIGR00697 family)
MNELLLILTAIVSAGFVFAAWRFGKERLYTVIIVFLILIASVGGKIVEFFGHETNTGNIFYASVFLATYFLIERFGKRAGIYSIWIGVLGIVFYTALVQMTVTLGGAETTAPLNTALATAYSPVSRLALASLIAYVLSQNLNVYLYHFLKQKVPDQKSLWLRANTSNFFAQICDSLVFFTIAFWGTVAPENIGEIILTGFIIKIVYMALASPLLYLNNIEEDETEEYATIALR